jgi:small subunit ribosomal protein S13
MARIAGIDLPRDKRVEIALTYIYGIGRSTSRKILETTKVNADTRVRDLTEDEVGRLREHIDKGHQGGGGPSPGSHHEHQEAHGNRLLPGDPAPPGPARAGQTTKNNARTRKGPKRTVGVRRKK